MEKSMQMGVITVEGIGYFECEANIIKIDIEIFDVKKTIKEAQNIVNKKISELITFLTENGVNSKDIHTTSINFGKHYEYEENEHGRDVRKYKGQKVSQNIIVFLMDLNDNLKIAINLLDNITEFNETLDLNVEFKIKDDIETTAKCRELAYRNALEKAQKYAEWANLKLIKAIKISEKEFDEDYDTRRMMLCAPSMQDRYDTNIPIGKISKTVKIFVDFITE